MRHWLLALGTCLATTALPSAAQLTGEQLATMEIKTQKVGEGLYVMFGNGGNIVVSVGADGVLIVDDGQFPQLVPRNLEAIRELGGHRVDLAINTHFHVDHADGNLVLGPTGTWFVAQANTREMLAKDRIVDTVTRPPTSYKPYPAAALPVFTFTERMQMHFNGDTLDLVHVGPAHTAGDAAVFFREHNAVHTGDVFNNAGYPYIDTDNGGDLDGTITFSEAILREIRRDTVVIPGHGPVGTYDDLVAYIEMLKGVRAKLAALVKSGATLEQVIAAKPTADWDARYGNPTRIVNRGYASLKRRR
jgi:glyoxylase-like metal-dependent hydrolase (beta-lactamase superfamily II)